MKKKRSGGAKKGAATASRAAPRLPPSYLRKPSDHPPEADPTPVDAPRGELAAPPELIEPPAVSEPFAAMVHASLARLEESDQLEALYDEWLELRLSWRQASARFEAERRRLEEQGALLLGALGVGGGAETPGLTRVNGDASALARLATERIAEAKRSLEAQLHEAQKTFERALVEAREVVRSRVEHRARTVRPRLSLMVRTLPGERRVLHARRPEPDEAVTLHAVLTGRIPSRYGFLFDDATDDVALGPPMLYAEEGVEADQVRPRPAALGPLLQRLAEVWPTKGVLPMWLPTAGGRTAAVRWLERGPVMEAEVEEGDAWRSVLTKEEAEAITGALLALKLEGRLELELVRG